MNVERARALRAAVYGGDSQALVELLKARPIADDLLQTAGDGLHAALLRHVDGAEELAGGRR